MSSSKTLCIGVSELLVRKSWYAHQQGIHHLGSPFNHFLSVVWKSHGILKGDLSTSHWNICLLLVCLISCLVLASCESDRNSQQEYLRAFVFLNERVINHRLVPAEGLIKLLLNTSYYYLFENMFSYEFFQTSHQKRAQDRCLIFEN